VPLSARSVRQPDPVVILGVDIKSDFVLRNLLVRKDANQLSCDGTAVLPASSLRQVLRVLIKFGRSDLTMFVKILLAGGKCLFYIAAEFAPGLGWFCAAAMELTADNTASQTIPHN
jgi:hypothetical protein